MVGQEKQAKKADKADVLRWIVNTGGVSTAGSYPSNRVAEAGKSAGLRVFEKIIKGQLK